MAIARLGFDRKHLDADSLKAESLSSARSDNADQGRDHDSPYPFAFGWVLFKYHSLWLDYRAAIKRVRELEAEVGRRAG